MPSPFPQRFGRWALVAGASEGLGEAFAIGLARRGMNLVLIARRAELLDALATRLRADHAIEVRTLALDLAGEAWQDNVRALAAELDLGLGVYNAAYSFVGALLDRPLADAERVVDVNARGPLRFVHALAPAMRTRGRGAIVLMSSLAGFQGSPRLAAYAASKAFITVLGESLWAELRPHGVEVLVSCAGAIRTPGYLATATRDAPGTLDPGVVAERTLKAIGKGPVVVPGAMNKVARFFLGRMLTRRAAVRVMAKSTADLS
ncbi:MAG: SDR family NAD(P)-dependent oxidoreductase [Deltaproteobacteria bacterium]|nr:SDR family NAD(P)-dependent oxidoreductase [Deltaproteobacteria bacterium]